MSEFPASQAREYTDNHEHINAESWYLEYKYKLFENIKDEALSGINSITINSDDWGKNETKKKYLLVNLESLGYKTILEKDNYGECIIISW